MQAWLWGKRIPAAWQDMPADMCFHWAPITDLQMSSVRFRTGRGSPAPGRSSRRCQSSPPAPEQREREQRGGVALVDGTQVGGWHPCDNRRWSRHRGSKFNTQTQQAETIGRNRSKPTFQDSSSWGEVMTNCSTFSNWCTLREGGGQHGGWRWGQKEGTIAQLKRCAQQGSPHQYMHSTRCQAGPEPGR